jgi:DNA/RNA endonuclease YhcR with UshA esterase domain
MKRFSTFLYSLVLAAAAAPALAHHSAAQFDFSKTVMLEGKVKAMEVQNPHTKLVLEIEENDGTVKDIEFEGHSRNNIYRRGWRPGMVHEGDDITIGIAPRKDGGDGGYVTSYKLEDGTEF